MGRLLTFVMVFTGNAYAAPADAADPITQVSTAQTNGPCAAATCTVSSTISRIECLISDSAVDSYPVYVRWEAIAGQNGRLKNNDGNRSDVTRVEDTIARAIDGSAFLRWRVCVNVQGWKDRCSADVNEPFPTWWRAGSARRDLASLE